MEVGNGKGALVAILDGNVKEEQGRERTVLASVGGDAHEVAVSSGAERVELGGVRWSNDEGVIWGGGLSRLFLSEDRCPVNFH